MKFLIFFLLSLSSVYAQVTVGRSVDFTSASSTKPFKAGTSDPGTCVAGVFFYRTDTALPKHCSSTNTWSELVVTNGTYSDPSWLSISKSKVGLANVENTALSTWAGSANITTLGTISTGTVPWANIGSKPTFASANTASAVVQRDASGNFIAGTITAALTGNASTSTNLAANGSNCSAGQAALGVDASGAAEGCYDPNTYRSGQINFVYGGSATALVDAATINNVWRAHAHNATITEIACWTDAGTVSLTIQDSAANAVASALSCGTAGASTTTINGYGAIGAGEGIGFITASVDTAKNLSVSIKYTRSY